MTFITSNYQTQCAKAFGTSLQLGMQEDTHVCVSEPHKKGKKRYLLEIDPVMTPLSKWEWHMPLNGVFLNIQVVLS